MRLSLKGQTFVRWAPLAAVLFTAASASAQDATVGAGASTTLPPRPVAAPAAYSAPAYAPAAGNDHDLWVGHFGVGWYGTRDVRAGAAGQNAAVNPPVPTALVGVRYWLSPTLGIDAALGFGISSGSVKTGDISADKASRTAFVLHGGVPLVLGNSRHFSFQVTPELDLGFASGKNGPDDVSGFLLNLGARAGAEIYFGFIGIPALALDASVGLGLSMSSGKTSPANGPATSDSDFRLNTSVQNNPWDIFRSNVAARYYF
jgi:hypothetical protein